MTTDRVPPHNLDAERAVLGGVLINSEALNDADTLKPSDFYRKAHQRIFETLIALANQSVEIDLVTVKNALITSGWLEDIGGASYLASLQDGVPHSTNVAHYAAIVREKAALRRLITAGVEMLDKAFDASEPSLEILEAAERAIIGLADTTAADGFESMRTIALRGMELLEKAHAARTTLTGCPTGFTQLDDLTHGLQPGALVTLGARPGIGKTSLASNIAQHAATCGRIVAMFSLEMGKEELFFRQVAATAQIDSHRLQSGYLGAHEWTRVSQAVSVVAESGLYVDETPAIGVFELRSRTRRLKSEHGLDLVVIDYLQLMGTPEKSRENRNAEVGAITSALKALARELKVPVLLLSQLTREPEKRGTRPRLSDLRDSGSIEQDSDVVLFLHRPEGGESTALTDLIVAKHRNGPVGTIKLAWFEEQTRYANHSTYEEPVDQRLPVGDR